MYSPPFKLSSSNIINKADLYNTCKNEGSQTFDFSLFQQKIITQLKEKIIIKCPIKILV